MSQFSGTADGVNFVATADSRETSECVMWAIAYHARDLSEAERFWQGDFPHHDGRWEAAIWETATQNGAIDDTSLFWGGRTLNQIVTQLAD